MDATLYRRPYLNLRERLSQVWFNYYTVVALLLILKLVLFKKSLADSLSEAQGQTMTLCQQAERYSSTAASMPHYMSTYANVLVAKAVQEANYAFVEGLGLALTGAKNLILFAISVTIGTYTCLLTAAVNMAADVGLNATESVIDLANSTIKGVASELDNGLEAVSDVANSVISAVDAVANIFTDSNSTDLSEKIGELNFTISSLDDWQIPGSIDGSINKVRSYVPNFDDVQNYTESLISIPFEEVRRHISSNNLNTLPPDELYVPDKRSVTFCDNATEIDQFYQDANRTIYKTCTILVGVLVFVILGLILWESWCTYRNWRRINDAAKSLQNGSSQLQYNISVIDSFQNRAATVVCNAVVNCFKMVDATKISLVRWIVNYMASPYAMSVLLLGLAGLLMFGFQYIILNALDGVDTNGLKKFATGASNQVRKTVESSIDDWCNHTNEYILDLEADINGNVLGWVQNVSDSVNDTVSEFVTEMNGAIKDVFGDSLLYDAVQGVVGCMLTSKLKKVQTAMEWLYDVSEVTLPQINSTDLTGASSSSLDVNREVASVKERVNFMLKEMVDSYKKSLLIELYISLGLLGLWVLIVLLGAVILFSREYRQKIPEMGPAEPGSDSQTDPTAIPRECSSKFSLSTRGFFEGPGLINKKLASLFGKLSAATDNHWDQDNRSSVYSYTDDGMEAARRWKW